MVGKRTASQEYKTPRKLNDIEIIKDAKYMWNLEEDIYPPPYIYIGS